MSNILPTINKWKCRKDNGITAFRLQFVYLNSCNMNFCSNMRTNLPGFAAALLVRVSASFLITTGHCLLLLYLSFRVFTNFYNFGPSLLKMRYVVFLCQLLRSMVLAAFLYFADAFFINMLVLTEAGRFIFLL